jgi:hypothetical protein
MTPRSGPSGYVRRQVADKLRVPASWSAWQHHGGDDDRVACLVESGGYAGLARSLVLGFDLAAEHLEG